MRKAKIVELLFPHHIVDLIELGKSFAEEKIFQDEYVDEDILIQSCHNVIADTTRKHINCFISYLDDEPVGFLVGVTTRAFHRNMVVAEQKLWYVKPSARQSRAALMLLDEYELWARINGATQIFTGSANKKLAEQTSKIFIRRGFAQVGAIHLKEVI